MTRAASGRNGHPRAGSRCLARRRREGRAPGAEAARRVLREAARRRCGKALRSSRTSRTRRKGEASHPYGRGRGRTALLRVVRARFPGRARLMNVLIASDDGTFRRVACFLFRRRGFCARETTCALLLGELRKGAHPDAIVLDARDEAE